MDIQDNAKQIQGSETITKQVRYQWWLCGVFENGKFTKGYLSIVDGPFTRFFFRMFIFA